MRIGIDYTSAATQGAGIGRYTRELMRALLALPADNCYSFFYASRHRIEQSAISSQQAASSKQPSAIRRLPFHDKWLMRVWQRLRIPIPVELIVGKVDLFHSPDFTLPPTLPGVPTLLTVHDLSFIRDPDSAWPSLRAFLNQAVPRSVKRATHVLADSQATKNDLIELFGTPAEKITVLYSGVEARFAPVHDRTELDRVCAKYQLPRPFILSIGTLQPRKNYGRLIEAFGQLVAARSSTSPLRGSAHALSAERGRAGRNVSPGYHLVITGGQGWMAEPIFEQVKRSGLESRVHFPGFVDDVDLPALYSAADLFAYVSLYEGFGLPLLEAMACGTPVVGSKVSSLPEVIGEAGLQVDPRDVADIAHALQQMIEQPDLRARSIELGLERAKLFTWDKAARELLAIYDHVAHLR
ncbi:mannosyl-N-acetyl-alpha-D-glucosaminyl-diphospho-ditrans,octacis-undecaprenol 3-alpha-mannosyltransferase / alpha-1,3-rhamnosyltransferase [Thermoflexales bacterium]|nr:mannosyl-N-acetyl-alpha-D-glucosaminyl-diphospho-ditrans,octacis-undecaprenol 3-alpha-mannosyltransferase / alpha-1,3-rhamnosyltransferase [Thermoflexales bacterium]